MELVDNLKKHLFELLGVEISIIPWKDQNKLPLFLLDGYIFFEASLLNNRCLVIIPKNEVESTPKNIQSHFKQIAKWWDNLCIYVAGTISNYNRNRLIHLHIPFIIPKNQIYIPDLGIDLREHFKQQRTFKELFSPATQVAVISKLLEEQNQRLTPTELASKLKYSAMSMTRALNELETAGIGKMEKKGKERQWVYEGSKKDLWEQTHEKLRSPIRSREFMKYFPGRTKLQMPLAGLCALAETTMIYSSPLPIYALGVEEYRLINNPKGIQLSSRDEADFELELWNYDPMLFSKDGRVDSFSLFLSLKETHDERIETALEELMEKIEW